MRILLFFLTAVCAVVTSCTKDKTDYEAEIDTVVTEYYEFKEALTLTSGNYRVQVDALNGTLYKGYNELHVKITNSLTNEIVKAESFTFLPIMNDSSGELSSCPHQYRLTEDVDKGYFPGYAVFTNESSASATWSLYVGFVVEGKTYTTNTDITVKEQTNMNLNMTTFTGKDEEQYVIALVAPQKPKVAENELLAGIYKMDKPSEPSSAAFPDPTQFSYSKVENYTLQLDPRMPEPSMGNHSSLNNKDLTQQSDGLYHGVVNYTMTGNWTLNFIMLNQNGQILKGTVVPDDFTPGVEGVRSELHLDILF
ncbi:hypothetical protein [Sphingobacterium sp. LRF_L2]|uniref:hypothetical protein n=1 Tax=Sphingobacterium sp. LRF_L2 TaxID=3369421 RepID=UPI003F63966F